MCQTSSHRHSIQCILPPHMLRSIILRGSPEQREHALRNYELSHTVRTRRAIQSSLSTGIKPFVSVIPSQVGTTPQVQRIICNTHNSTILPGEIVRVEGQGPTGDPAVDEAYDGLGSTFEFYLKAYQRNSIDNQGLPLLGTVHYDVKYDNAFWDGQQMVFGDGDGQLFNRFTISLDVIGHELTHGVTQTDAKLIFQDQSGALNESISDVFGSLVKQFARNQTANQADWLIGEGLFTNNVQGKALRSLKAPGTAFDDPILGKDPQPANMKDYVHTPKDNGGVHTNSGIPNHAFFLVAQKIGGYAWEKAGLIWYNTLHSPGLQPNADFQSFAQLTALTADQLYGQGSVEGQAVREAWDQVGISLMPVAPIGLLNGQDSRKQRIKDALSEISDLLALA
ncbi:MAG TPA: M4 family metallopeptidase [Ktedonobacteraceae bacterium]|nr:M4 family metallopeptidase [Ktedonobacteraceae bacterium]